MTVVQPVDQVKIAGSAAAGADDEAPGEVSLRAGCEGRHFLVPHVYPFDLALAPQRVRDAVETVADDAVHALDAGARENLDELIRDRSGHHVLLAMRLGARAASAHQYLGAIHARVRVCCTPATTIGLSRSSSCNRH